MNSEIKTIKTDVAIIGGGTAGLNTAMAAAEKGCDVLVVDKAGIARSGAIAGGIDHFHAYLETGEPWDTREAYLEFVSRVSRGASNLKVHEAVFCDELKDAMARVERIGISLRSESTGKIFRTQAIGQPGPYAINFNGKKLKPAMAKEVRRLGCKVLERVQVTSLVTHNGHLAGFTGYNMRTGDFYQIQAKAVVIATGNTNRMFKAQTGNPFNLWYCPACTGDLHRAAFEAGVELANMEYVRMTIVPKGFSAPGFNAFFGMDSKLVNSLGDTFMHRYHPMAEKAPRNFMVWGATQEIKEGRGPIYMDCSHLSEAQRTHLFTTLGYDKDTLPDFFVKKGYNVAGTMIEMTPSECMQARPSELAGSGIKIDETCASNIPGLFAAGDASDQMGCLHMCTAGGYAAGKNAAVYAQKTAHHLPMDEKAVKDEQGRIFRPLSLKNGIAFWEFENIVRNITSNHFGPLKTEQSLKSALVKLENLDSHRDELKAENLHDLMRVHEALNIQQVAKISATAAEARKETRFAPFHYRADYPDTNDKDFCGLIVVKKGDAGKITTRFERITY